MLSIYRSGEIDLFENLDIVHIRLLVEGPAAGPCDFFELPLSEQCTASQKFSNGQLFRKLGGVVNCVANG